MTTRVLLTTSAVFLPILGLGTLFLPHESLAFLGIPQQGALAVLVQLLGAYYLTFALLNWMARDSLIGGIYNRPTGMGNLGHFGIGTIVLIKGSVEGQIPGIMWLACGFYALFAGWFTAIFFSVHLSRHVVRRTNSRVPKQGDNGVSMLA